MEDPIPIFDPGENRGGAHAVRREMGISDVDPVIIRYDSDVIEQE